MNRIFDQQRFLVSFSQIQLIREIPMPENQKIELKALGLFDPAAEGPMLPCALTMSPQKGRDFGRATLVRIGHLHDPHVHYRLEIRISDEMAEAARAVRDAFTAAAITNKEFLRIAFHTAPCDPRGRAQLLLNEGFCEGPEIIAIVFGAGMTLGAPDWSWAWDAGELDAPAFHDLALSRFRKGQRK